MRYVAHRGYSLEFPDNSVAAIRGALERKYSGVEIDIQLCGTGEIVLHHDVYVDDVFIKDSTINELREKGIITLGDVYREVPDIRNTRLLLDIKGNDLKIIDALKLFYATESTANVIFCSFNRSLLYSLPSEFRKGSTFETSFNVDEYDMITRGLSAVLIHWTCLSHSFITYCRFKDIEVYTYTHKEHMELEYMSKFNVNFVITNGLA